MMKLTKDGKTILLTLDEILSHIMFADEIGGTAGERILLSMSNLDDVFLSLKRRGVNEVIVSRSQMITITLFMCSNTRTNDSWDAFRALSEGKVNKFLGVKLKLDET